MEEYDLWSNKILKGRMTECIILHHVRPHAFSIRYLDKNSFLDNYPKKIPSNMREFLEKYWYALDVIKFRCDDSGEIKDLELYEVKNRNHVYCPRPEYSHYDKLCITQNSFNACKEGIRQGFSVYIAKVTFFYKWKIGVQLITFPEALSMLKINNGTFYKNSGVAYPLIE